MWYWNKIKKWMSSKVIKEKGVKALVEIVDLGFDEAALAVLGEKAIIAKIGMIAFKNTVDVKNERFWEKIRLFAQGAYLSDEDKGKMRKKLSVYL